MENLNEFLDPHISHTLEVPNADELGVMVGSLNKLGLMYIIELIGYSRTQIIPRYRIYILKVAKQEVQ